MRLGFGIVLVVSAVAGCGNDASTDPCVPPPFVERTFNLVWPNSPQSSLAKVVVSQFPAGIDVCLPQANLVVQVIHATLSPVRFDLRLALDAPNETWTMQVHVPFLEQTDTLRLTMPFEGNLAAGTLRASVQNVMGLVPIR